MIKAIIPEREGVNRRKEGFILEPLEMQALIQCINNLDKYAKEATKAFQLLEEIMKRNADAG